IQHAKVDLRGSPALERGDRSQVEVRVARVVAREDLARDIDEIEWIPDRVDPPPRAREGEIREGTCLEPESEAPGGTLREPAVRVGIGRRELLGDKMRGAPPEGDPPAWRKLNGVVLALDVRLADVIRREKGVRLDQVSKVGGVKRSLSGEAPFQPAAVGARFPSGRALRTKRIVAVAGIVEVAQARRGERPAVSAAQLESRLAP